MGTRVAHAGHGFSIGDKVTYSSANAVGGVDMNGTFTIVDVDTVNHYVVEARTEVMQRRRQRWTYVNALNGLGAFPQQLNLLLMLERARMYRMVNWAAGIFTDLLALNIFANVQVAAGANEAQKQANQAGIGHW